MKAKIPTAPSHLTPEAKKLWRAILQDFQIDDAAHLRVLQVGLEALDRAEACRQKINQVGELIYDRWKQPKANPLLAAERDARSAFVHAIKSLGLDPGAVQ